MPIDTTIKTALDIKVGDQLVERDGALLDVVAIAQPTRGADAGKLVFVLKSIGAVSRVVFKCLPDTRVHVFAAEVESCAS